MTFYQLEWDVPFDPGTWQENTAFFAPITAGILVLIMRAVLTARATKRTGTPPSTLRRWLGVVAAVLIIVAPLVGEFLVNTEGRRWRQREAALLSEHWHVAIVDIRRLPGRKPAQNVSLVVDSPTGRRTCVLSSYARTSQGDGRWLTGWPQTRGGGQRQMRFEMTCP